MRDDISAGEGKIYEDGFTRAIGTRSGQWRKDRTAGVFAVENEYTEGARKYVKAASRGRRL